MKGMLVVFTLAGAVMALDFPTRSNNDTEAKEVLGGEQLYLLTDLVLTDAAMEQHGSCEETNSQYMRITYCYKASEHDSEVKCEAWPSIGSEPTKDSTVENVTCERWHSLGLDQNLDSKDEEMRSNEWESARPDSKIDPNGQKMVTIPTVSTEITENKENKENEVYDKKEFSCFLGSLHLGDTTLYLALDGQIRVFVGLSEDQLGSDLTENQFKAKELAQSQIYSLEAETDVFTANNLAILKTDSDNISSIEREVCEFFYPRSKKTTKQQDTLEMSKEMPRGQPRLLQTLAIPGYQVQSEKTAAASSANHALDMAGFGGIYFLSAYIASDGHATYYLLDNTYSTEEVFTISDESGTAEYVSSFGSTSVYAVTYVISESGTKTIYGIDLANASATTSLKAITTSGELTSSTIYAGGNYILVWSDSSIDGDGSYGIAAISYGSTNYGSPSAEFQVNTYITNDQIRPKAATLVGGGYIVAWQSNLQDGSSYGIYAQKFNDDSTKNSSEFQLSDNGNYSQEDVDIKGLGTSGYAAVWVRDSGSEKRIECKTDTSSVILVDTNTQSGTESVSPSLTAVEDNKFIVTWLNKSPSSDYGTVYIQKFNADGTLEGGITEITSNAKLPHVAHVINGNYGIAWIDNTNNLVTHAIDKCTVTNCDACPSNVSTCSNCAAGYYLNGSTCVQCTDANCIDCPDASTCNDCSAGFFPNGSACDACTSPCTDCAASGADQCTMCAGNTPPSASPGWCECISGTYESASNPLVCSNCDSSCSECSGAADTECTVCSSGNDPSTTNGRCACASGTYQTTSNPLVCLSCHSSCSECSGPADTECTACSSGNDPSSTGGRCACPSSEYATATNPLACASCHSSCSECSGAADTECTACSSGNNPSTTNGRCACASGTYQTTSNPLVCPSCHSSCSECSGPADTECTACSSGNDPSATNGRCACPSSEYATATNPLACSSCDSSCSECSGAADTDCTVCSSGNNPSSTGGRCACPSSEYATTTNPLVCASCDSSCSECSGPADTECTACSSGNNPSTTNGRCACPSSEYATATNPLACSSCDSSCLECSGGANTDCTACSNPKFLDGTTCVDSCPNGKFVDGSTCVSSCPIGKYPSGASCLDCPSQCTACSASTACSACAEKYYLTNTGSCLSCPGSLCKTCTNSSCSTCVTNASLVDGTCQCDSGYYQSSGACVKLCDLCVSCDANSQCTCVDYATFVAGATSADLCQCSQSTQIGTLCVPAGDYYNNNDNIDRIEFNAEFLELAVYFKSSPAYVDISDASDCSNYVLTDTLALLGTSPSCSRAQSGTSITVTLGSGYTLRKGNSVFLNWLHIRETTSSLSTDHVSLSSTATGGDYPTPNVAITGLASLYLACEQTSVVYSTSVQTGAANNALTYRWSISPDLPTPLTNSQLVQSSLTIPNTAFGSVSIDYSVSVTATNVFGVSDTASVNLSVSAGSGISVSFAGGSPIQITSDDTRQIEPIAEQKCGETESVSYEWSFESTASGSIPSGTTLISDPITKRLIIQPGSHAPGETYNYRCTATSGNISGFSIFSFEVLYSQPVALMNIEDGTVSNANTLVLDSEGSNDPSNREISLLWSCVDQDSNTCQSSSGTALISSVNQSNAGFSIPATDLVVGNTLSISLTVTTSDNRSAVLTKTIEIVDGGSINIQTVAITKKVLVHRELIVKLDVSNGVSIRWSQISSPSISISSSLAVPYLWILPNTMTEGETYTFQATATDSNGKSVYIRISWTTNKPPSCGGEDLQMLSDSGFLATIGINDCFDQDETDLPLSYSFGAVWNGFVLPCVYRTLSNSLTVWTLPGAKQFVVFVCDKLGSCITKQSTITITRDRMLSSKTTIQADFYEAKNQNSDLVPLVILEMSNAYTLTETDWVFLFNELENYTNSVLIEAGIFDQTTVTTFMGTIAGLLTEYSAMSTSHVVQGVDYIMRLIQNSEDKLDSTDLELTSDTILGLTTNYASDNQIFSKVLALQAEVNNLQLRGGPSGESPFEFKSKTSGFASITQRITGEDISSLYTLSTTVGVNTYFVSARNISEIAASDLIDVEVIVTPSLSASDSVSVSFYKAGTYDSSTVSLTLSETRTLLSVGNLTDLINITVPYSYNSNLTYGVYVLENNKWTFDANIVLINQTDGFMIQTPHLSSFRVQEHVFEIIAASEGDCGFSFLPVGLMLVAILISTILVLSAWQLEKRSKEEESPSGSDLDETKNLSKRAKACNSAIERDSDNCIHRFTYYHTVFGQLHEGSVPMIDRASEIGISILRNMLFIGLFFYGVENVDEYKEEVDAEEYLSYGFYSSLISFFFISFSEFLIYSNSDNQKIKRIFRWVFVGILAAISIIAIAILSSIFCDTWSKIWCLVLFFALALEWIVYYTIYALIRLCITPRNRGVSINNFFK